MSSGDLWARRPGRHRVEAESGPPARPEPPSDEPAPPLVTQGGRSAHPAGPRPTPDAWMRGEEGAAAGWDRIEDEIS